MTVRFFIGGLPPQTSSQEISSRFVTFGSILSVEVPAARDDSHHAGSERGFAYVELKPKDENSVAKCLSAYHKSKWKGHVLRVEIAKPDFSKRIALEKEEERLAESLMKEEEALEVVAALAEAQVASKAIYIPIPGRKLKYYKSTVDGRLPDGKLRPKKTFFPPVVPKPLEALPWTSFKSNSALYHLNDILYLPSFHPPSSSGSNQATEKIKQPKEERAVSVNVNALPIQLPPSARPVLAKEQHGYLKILKALDTAVQKQVLQQQPLTDKVKAPMTIGTVDFLDGEEAEGVGRADGGLDRFDEDEDSGNEAFHDVDDDNAGGEQPDDVELEEHEEEEVEEEEEEVGDMEEAEHERNKFLARPVTLLSSAGQDSKAYPLERMSNKGLDRFGSDSEEGYKDIEEENVPSSVASIEVQVPKRSIHQEHEEKARGTNHSAGVKKTEVRKEPGGSTSHHISALGAGKKRFSDPGAVEPFLHTWLGTAAHDLFVQSHSELSLKRPRIEPLKLGSTFMRPVGKTDEELRSYWEAARAGIVADAKERIKREGRKSKAGGRNSRR